MNYLSDLYHNTNGEGFLSTWIKQSGHTKFFPLNELDKAQDYMLSRAGSEDIYFGWCPLGQVPAKGRGSSAATLLSPGIMFDADLRSDVAGVHSQANLPNSLDEVMDWLQTSGHPPPSQIRSSGNGLYLDWLHDEPVFFRSDADRSSYGDKVKSFHAHLRRSAKEDRGWIFDSTHDLARVTRMPGTLNHKTNPAKPVEVIQ